MTVVCHNDVPFLSCLTTCNECTASICSTRRLVMRIHRQHRIPCNEFIQRKWGVGVGLISRNNSLEFMINFWVLLEKDGGDFCLAIMNIRFVRYTIIIFD